MFRSATACDFGAWVDGAWTHIGGWGRWWIDFEPAEWAIVPPDIERDFVET